VLKEAVKRLCRWYLRYLGNQVVVLGRATARLGELLVERIDALEDTTGAMRRDVDQLAQRVEQLEARQVNER
jgi:BMFP domain-containing protein YqiC